MTTYLTTVEVMRRYRLNDPRAARRIMRETGCIDEGGRLLVQLADLEARDAAKLIVDSSSKSIKSPPVSRTRPPQPRRASVLKPLEAGWWNDGD